jgi:gliding motility-associated-like protein
MAVSSSLTVTSIPVNILCTGSSTGSIDILISGGTAPYTYAWTGTGTIQGNEDQTGLAAGSYSVVVTDANGCQSGALDVILTEPLTALSGTIASQTNALCAGSDNGSVTVAGAGGVGPYEYSINNGTFQVSGTFSALNAGSHVLTVRDANLCTSDVSVTITEPTALAVDYTTKPASCPDVADGSISLTISGGTAPYSVIWSDGLTSIDRNNIPDGSYSVIVTDANSCAEPVDIVLENTGSSACVVAQELITPNNDGFNDKWKIRNIEMFPDAEVLVYNRWGKLVFKTKNISENEWDGTMDGKLLPTDSYHYILYLNDGSEPRSGVISIIR